MMWTLTILVLGAAVTSSVRSDATIDDPENNEALLTYDPHHNHQNVNPYDGVKRILRLLQPQSPAHGIPVFDFTDKLVNRKQKVQLDCGSRTELHYCVWEKDTDIIQVEDVHAGVYKGMSRPENTTGNQCGIVIDEATIEDQGLWTCKIFTPGSVLIGSKNIIITDNCSHNCEAETKWVCGTNDKSYRNPCLLMVDACRNAINKTITTNHTGRCKHDNDCPQGLFSSEGSENDRCFKIFQEEKQSWSKAQAKCKKEGLVVPSQMDDIAISLRKYIIDHYAGTPVWLDAKGNGTQMIWQRNQMELSNYNHLWFLDLALGYPGERVTSGHCVTLTGVADWRKQELNPYASQICSTEQHTLCEYVCPDGYFRVKSSRRCFKMFKDKQRTWQESHDKCLQEGLVMPSHTNNISVDLREYLLHNYGGESWVHLNARGNDSSIVWGQRQQQEENIISLDNSLWATSEIGKPDQDELSPDYCLYLRVAEDFWMEEPQQPYGVVRCTWNLYTLCEVIKE